MIEVSNKLDNTGGLDSSVKDSLVNDPSFPGLRAGKLDKVPRPKPIHSEPDDKFTLYFDDKLMGDLWIALTWGREV